MYSFMGHCSNFEFNIRSWSGNQCSLLKVAKWEPGIRLPATTYLEYCTTISWILVRCKTLYKLCWRYGRGGGNYDGVSRGKSYDRGVGGYQNSVSQSSDTNGPGGQSRELSRSMSNDNWRDTKSSLTAEDHRGGGGGGSRGWGQSHWCINIQWIVFPLSSNWRHLNSDVGLEEWEY